MSSRTRRGVDQTGRSTGTFADARFKKLNKPPLGEPFIWITREMISSPAWRALSETALKVIFRVLEEHMAHGGGQNGALPVTYDDFQRYGLRRSSIKAALEEAIALGFLERTKPGVRSYAEFKGAPAHYRIAWLPTYGGARPTRRWARIQTLEEAREAVRASRSRHTRQRKVSSRGAENSIGSAEQEKQKPSSENVPVSSHGSATASSHEDGTEHQSQDRDYSKYLGAGASHNEAVRVRFGRVGALDDDR